MLGLWALIGLGAGILIPNQVAALLIGVGVAWIVEPILGAAIKAWDFGQEHIAPYLPSEATQAVVNVTQASADDVRLSWWGGALALAAWAAAFAGAGILRRGPSGHQLTGDHPGSRPSSSRARSQSLPSGASRSRNGFPGPYARSSMASDIRRKSSTRWSGGVKSRPNPRARSQAWAIDIEELRVDKDPQRQRYVGQLALDDRPLRDPPPRTRSGSPAPTPATPRA